MSKLNSFNKRVTEDILLSSQLSVMDLIPKCDDLNELEKQYLKENVINARIDDGHNCQLLHLEGINEELGCLSLNTEVSLESLESLDN